METVAFAGVGGPDDVGVVETPDGLGLAEEALDEALLGCAQMRQHLDGHVPLEALMLGLEDHTHATLTQLGKDPVLANAGRERLIRPKRGGLRRVWPTAKISSGGLIRHGEAIHLLGARNGD